MDFKVAGTVDGITSLQMDIKVDGITQEIMEVALTKALNARKHILNEMNKVLSKARKDTKPSAPELLILKSISQKLEKLLVQVEKL